MKKVTSATQTLIFADLFNMNIEFWLDGCHIIYYWKVIIWEGPNNWRDARRTIWSSKKTVLRNETFFIGKFIDPPSYHPIQLYLRSTKIIKFGILAEWSCTQSVLFSECLMFQQIQIHLWRMRKFCNLCVGEQTHWSKIQRKQSVHTNSGPCSSDYFTLKSSQIYNTAKFNTIVNNRPWKLHIKHEFLVFQDRTTDPPKILIEFVFVWLPLRILRSCWIRRWLWPCDNSVI